jgi:NADH dehydrogenase
VVVGAGFGGLPCALALRGEPVDVTVVNRENYHLFTPLLYQVASCLLNPAEIAAPLRKVFRGAPNLHFRLGDVVDVDFDGREVRLADGSALPYDHLVLSPGSTTNYFGNDAVAAHSLGLKNLGEALELRNHVLLTLEQAALERDPVAREALLTFCIVGGGPTGVEYAGALAELIRLVLPREYPELSSSDVRIVLLEGTDRLLSMFRPRLSEYALRQLARRGVAVRFGQLVASVEGDAVVTRDGVRIVTSTVVWTAGVRPADLTDDLDVARTPRRRIAVDDHLRVVGRTGVYAIGDSAAVHDRKGNELPMVSPPAMQAGRYVAREIMGGNARAFRYRDKGTLATIGRTAAVGEIGPFQLTGFVGWLVWLVVHLYYLIGFENRAAVLLRWSWYYVRLDRPVRSVIRAKPPRVRRQVSSGGDAGTA